MSPPEESRFSMVLARIRREGVWVLAGAAPLASVKVWALVAGPEAAAAATRIAPGDLLLAGLALAAAVEVLVFKKPWRSAIPPAAAFGWVAVAAISAVVMVGRGWGDLSGAAAKGSVREVVQLVEILIIGYGWTLWAVRDGRDLERALLAIGVAVTLNVGLAVVQLASGEHVFYVRGLFANRNSLGVFLVVTLPLLVAAASSDRKRPAPVRLWLLGVSSIGLATMTSGGLFAAAVAGVIVAAFASSKRAGWAALAALAVIVLLIQPVGLPHVREAQYRSVEPFHEARRDQWAPSERARRWAAVLECLRENPTFGVGPGRFQARIERYYLQGWGKGGGSRADPDAFDVTFDEPGSQGLWEVVACETGLAGCLAVVWFLVAALVRSGSAARRASRDELDAQDADGSGPGPTDNPARPTKGAALWAPEFAAGALGSAAAVAVAGVFAAVFVQGVALPFVIVLALGERSRSRAPQSA